MRKTTQKLRIAAFAAVMLIAGAANAQTDPAATGPAAGTLSPNTTQAEADGPSIRLIDNKGTIKYMQANNGITTITSTAPGQRTTTTWQLGGELLEDTTIDAGTNAFTIGGENFILADVAQEVSGVAATAATIGTAGAPGSGFTVLVRDEATGNTRKILASDLLQVQSGSTQFVALAAQDNTTADLPITVAGDNVTPNINNISVYRNGAKLRATVDYVVDAAGIVTITPSANGLVNQDWVIFQDDYFEIQWVN